MVVINRLEVASKEDINLVETKRKKLSLTQDNIAEMVGISRQYYNEIENRKREPSVRIARRLSKILGLKWTIFFNN